MTEVVWVYVEGGGDRRGGAQEVRLAFQQFFRELHGGPQASRASLNVVPCGGRDNAFSRFRHDTLEAGPREAHLLLVDAEGPVVSGSARAHLAATTNWSLVGIADNQVHLMVQAFETWLLADRDALAGFYGPRFAPRGLPVDRDLENVPKAGLLPALNAACRQTPSRQYEKTRHLSKLVERLDPQKVRAACSYCRRLFDELCAQVGIPPLP